MKKIRNCTVVIMALFLALSGAAWGFDANEHVKVAPDGKGDVLIFPFYAAFDTYETEISVVNTSTTLSTVAKVVVRSMRDTQELLDFLIYLSPCDVWKGTLRAGSDGLAEIVSADDSFLTSSTPTFASAAAPFAQNLAAAICGDTNQVGYVEVFGVASWNAGARPLAKTTVYAQYWNRAPVVVNNVPANMPENVLTGHMEFRNTAIGQSSAIQATVLRDYDNLGGLTIGRDTRFSDTTTRNSIIEVEAALSKNSLAMEYSNQTLAFHVITFPTKLTRRTSSTCALTGYDSLYFTDVAPIANGAVTYAVDDYDLSENTQAVASPIFSPAPATPTSSLPGEVNIRAGFAFTEGWSHYVFPNGATNGTTTGRARDGLTDIAFTGIPAIATVLQFDNANGFYMHQGAATPGVVTQIDDDADGTTAFTPVTLDYYQFAD